MQPPLPTHTHTHIHTRTLFLMDNIKMMEIITTKIKWKMHALFTLYFKFWRIQPPDFLFFVVFISFYISRSHFSQIFRTSFNITWKRDFCHKFSFFNRFTQTAPLNGQNPLSVTKVFLSMLPLCAYLWYDLSYSWHLDLYTYKLKKDKSLTNGHET